MRIEAEVIKYGDDISTDLIYPGRYTYLLLTEEQMLSTLWRIWTLNSAGGTHPTV